ncbi:VOC family protein [Tsukamurella soli]
MRGEQAPEVGINLLVLYVADLEASRDFYKTLGLPLIKEQHAAGPVHFSATFAGGTVLELYPVPPGMPPSRVRLPDPAEAIERLRDARFTVTRTGLAIDPDGNRVVIEGAG